MARGQRNHSPRVTSDWTAALNDAKQNRDDGDDEQQVNQPTDVEREKPERPENYEYDGQRV